MLLAETESVGHLALRFLILTAARSGEVRGATWEEIDLKGAVWTVPASRMKAGKAHMVPLSDAAIAVLREAWGLRTGKVSEPVFPRVRGNVMSDATLSKVLRDTGEQSATVHGFRSSFRDWAAECTAIPGEAVEAALAHTIANRVEAAYRRTNYLEKRRVLMDQWAKFVVRSESNRQ
jgi:integrase